MITEEIRQILNSDKDESECLNRVVDEFRDGRNVSELTTLLCSECGDLIRIGTWILTEIPSARYNDRAFVNRLHELTQHSDSAIRLYAFSALFPFLKPDDLETASLLTQMRNDKNEGVRMTVDAAASRLGIQFNDYE